MKLYTDQKNGYIIHVVDGMGFILSPDITAMGRGLAGDATHKACVVDALNDWKAGDDLDVLTNDKPFESIVEGSYEDYQGKTLDEILAEFCPEAPEEI